MNGEELHPYWGQTADHRRGSLQVFFQAAYVKAADRAFGRNRFQDVHYSCLYSVHQQKLCSEWARLSSATHIPATDNDWENFPPAEPPTDSCSRAATKLWEYSNVRGY